ncbi:MAG TPA: hypothetical protein VLJ42_07200 [Solirubrobacteraceae bacterium]|nr:hypothetical protein [Solirubrobacteraceae bacterium]
MSKDRIEEPSERGIKDDEEFQRKMGISRASLRAIDTCPFIDELTRLNHAPVAVLEAEYIAELARRNHDSVAALEADHMVELAWLNYERARAKRLASPLQASGSVRRVSSRSSSNRSRGSSGERNKPSPPAI